MVAVTVDGTTLEGYFAIGSESFFIEPANKYSSHANNDDKVIYKAQDKIKNKEGICSLGEMVDIASRNLSVKLESTLLEGRRVLEIATEADKDYAILFTNPTAPQNFTMSVLNTVDGIYKNQLNLRLSVTYQHFWAANTTNDPYAGITDPGTLLQAFKQYWILIFHIYIPNTGGMWLICLQAKKLPTVD